MLTEQSRRRYAAFWDRSCADRPPLYLTVRRQAGDGFPEPTDNYQRWADMDYRLNAARWNIGATLYMADGFPNAWVNMGPGVLAAMIGSEYGYAESTVWFGHNEQLLAEGYGGMDRLALRADNPMNAHVLEFTRRMCREGVGKYLTGITDIGGTLDVLASLRGTETLLYDVVDDADNVVRARDIIDALWEKAYTESYDIIRAAYGGPMTGWIPLWCDKRWFPLQCDFSAMISPDAFERLVLPSLERHTRFLDHSVYHLDGPGELPHVDMLLGLNRLDAIQWVPGAGNYDGLSEHWYPLYERIQRAGKGLVMTLGEHTAEQLITFMKNMSPNGLFIQAQLPSAEEAREVEGRAGDIWRR